ncbi:MAG: hypothetical protein ABWY48_08880 [Pseudoxanthomonas sp.]
MERRRFALLLSLSVSALAPPCLAATQEPVLRLSGGDFPELTIHQPSFDEAGNPLPMACDRIRAKRIDELDPLWKRSMDRIHLECEELNEENSGFDMVATTLTGFVRAGMVEFAGQPLAEVRLMDSDLWSDHQYILQRPYEEAREALKRFIESRCQAQQDDPAALVENSCALTESEEGLYLQASELGGIWVHPDRDDPQRTVYAEAWSD